MLDSGGRAVVIGDDVYSTLALTGAKSEELFDDVGDGAGLGSLHQLGVFTQYTTGVTRSVWLPTLAAFGQNFFVHY